MRFNFREGDRKDFKVSPTSQDMANVELLLRERQKGNASGYVGTDITQFYDKSLGPVINLGLAASPIGPAPELVKVLENQAPRTTRRSAEYAADVNHEATKLTLLDGIGLKIRVPDDKEKAHSVIFYGNGSYGAGDDIVRHLARKGYQPLLAPAYSFPNVAQWAGRNRVGYKPLPGDSLNPAESLKEVLKLNGTELTKRIVYMDYPNNPTGQVNGNLIRDIVDHVQKNGGIPIVDMAFGEVLGDEFRSMIQYTIDHGGIALGSLSKTQGLPGLRTGYAILAPELASEYSGSERLVFGLPREAELAYQTLFSKQKNGKTLAQLQAERAAKYNTEANAQLKKGLEKLGLTVLDSDPRVPIQVVASSGKDFYFRLGVVSGIKTESLHDYSETLSLRRGNRGYEDSAVRMLTPKKEDIDKLLRRIKIALS